jgi:hypothetical protein
MAKTIEPISSWQNGEEKQATVFILTSSYDNLLSNLFFIKSIKYFQIYL